MCLCYLFSAKTAWQLVNRNADFFSENESFESIRLTNRIDSNRELECSSSQVVTCWYRVTYLIGGVLSLSSAAVDL